MIAVRSNQCYLCDDDTDKDACGDPFDFESMKLTKKIAMPPGGACLVSFHGKIYSYRTMGNIFCLFFSSRKSKLNPRRVHMLFEV